MVDYLTPNFNFFNVYFWEKERERNRAWAFAQAGEGQRERGTEDPKQAVC